MQIDRKRTKNEILKTLVQFIKFGIVGVSNTLIAYGVYVLCVFLGMHYILANTIAFIVSVLNAYYWNSRHVFHQSKDVSSKEKASSAVKLFTSYTFTFLLSTALLALWIDCLGIDKNIAPLINYCITIPLNFLLNKLWVFHCKEIVEK